MSRHIFRKVGDGPWEDFGSYLLEKYVGDVRSEATLLADLTELANLREGPPIKLEVRDVPDNTEGTYSGR